MDEIFYCKTPQPQQAPTGTDTVTPPFPPHQQEDNKSEKEPEIQVENALPVRCELEGFTRFSECHLWKLMMSFYHRQGVDSWAQGIVPHFITCNAFIGRAYARVLHSFINDSLAEESLTKIDRTEPLYIIELGAGSGKFSFFMVKSLLERQAQCNFPTEKIKYIMTDFTETNFNFWKGHPALQEYVENGIIDFAIFNATCDEEITLWKSKTVLRPGSVKNPICIVANYLFDTLYHDSFQIDQGILKEGLISVGTTRLEEPDPLDPEIIKRLSNKSRYEPTGTDYYKDDADGEYLEQILRWYQAYFKSNSSGASILVPIGALRALRHLSALSDRKAIVISGDKGHNNPDHFIGLTDPHIAVHGSFSVMVNYHAIGMYFTSQGGFALHNPQEEASLKVSVFVMSNENESNVPNDDSWIGDTMQLQNDKRIERYPNLHSEFLDQIESFGPNDFFVMQKSLKEDASNPNLKSVVALLKLGDWDPDVFYKFRDTILDQVPSATAKLRGDLCRGIPRVWQNYYALDQDKDIAFEIGRFYYGVREYFKALNFYEISLRAVGEHHVTFHNVGLCHYSQGELETALKHFEKAVAMCPEYEKATIWMNRVKAELKPIGANSAQHVQPIGMQQVQIEIGEGVNEKNAVLRIGEQKLVVNGINLNHVVINKTEPVSNNGRQNNNHITAS